MISKVGIFWGPWKSILVPVVPFWDNTLYREIILWNYNLDVFFFDVTIVRLIKLLPNCLGVKLSSAKLLISYIGAKLSGY